jgi:hypothetical protein
MSLYRHEVSRYLFAWGDQLFEQDTIESINEMTRRYVLAANFSASGGSASASSCLFS